MPRRPRDIEPGAVLHVTSRGVDRQSVFIDAHDRQRFLALLAGACRSGRLQCLDFCLMGNHFHLAARALDEPFGDVMRDCLGRYVRAFNERHEREGHLFERRYHAKRVRSERHLFALARYLAYNPVAAGLCATPHAWQWSGCRELSGTVAPAIVDVGHALSYFGSTTEVGRRAYLELVADASEQNLSLSTVTCAPDPELRRAAIFAADAVGCAPDQIATAASLHVKSVERLLRHQRNKGARHLCS